MKVDAKEGRQFVMKRVRRDEGRKGGREGCLKEVQEER